ncbi:eukaryotic translation initiation factor 3 subunit E [Capsaspora owczarzaki ATCC 30864]|uniref:eukaryotic translation initiation factor 3 subunit E n=1 Tax=Capsaspora owczarzaki (strain ATCC 30864) TaxID=595528 RepID=UPI0001FE2E24|nr:eukaryotic translation initiation factor 3 subunit E [Capsaspora owczarzaki ATCC 30864]|eukprot:XP_004349023.1 eukaryotic translation initiation factor 3 subunit E [Capsaspora owczarzaki ATCC 30864]
MAAYDLSTVLGQHLDRHLVLPLLDFLQTRGIYADEEIARGKLDLISSTNMVDFAIDIYKTIQQTEEAPADLVEKRESTVARLKVLHNSAEPVLNLFQNEEVIKQLRQDKQHNLQYLQQHHQFQPEMLDTLYEYAKFQFDCGNYTGAADYLYHFNLLSTDTERTFSALWGKLACEILLHNWETALEEMTRLKEIIDSRTFATPLLQLQQRTWLIHWSLFIFFHHPRGRDGIVDLFFQTPYLNAIQTTCPHMLRYLATAVITNKRRRPMLKDLVRIIQQESYTYRDPITQLLECLYVNYDFDAAQLVLRECEKVVNNDFFLCSLLDDFIESARMLIFETYCRIHEVISIGLLAEKLNMTADDAERWIVNLIRNAKMDAKIDSQLSHVVMGAPTKNIHQDIIEKTNILSFRAQLLSSALDKLPSDSQKVQDPADL